MSMASTGYGATTNNHSPYSWSLSAFSKCYSSARVSDSVYILLGVVRIYAFEMRRYLFVIINIQVWKKERLLMMSETGNSNRIRKKERQQRDENGSLFSR